MLKRVKDVALSKGLKVAINSQIKEYGKMLKFNLDSKNKCLDMEIMLDGEVEPISIVVSKYELIKDGNKHLLKVHEVKTSRAWMDTVASLYLEGKSFNIPAQYASMLKAII